MRALTCWPLPTHLPSARARCTPCPSPPSTCHFAPTMALLSSWVHFTHLNVRVSRFQRHLAASPPRALHGHVPWSTQGVARPAPSSSPSRKGVLPAASDVRVPAPFAGAFLIFCFVFDGDLGRAQHAGLMMLPMVCGLPCVPAIRASASPARAPILAAPLLPPYGWQQRSVSLRRGCPPWSTCFWQVDQDVWWAICGPVGRRRARRGARGARRERERMCERMCEGGV